MMETIETTQNRITEIKRTLQSENTSLTKSIKLGYELREFEKNKILC